MVSLIFREDAVILTNLTKVFSKGRTTLQNYNLIPNPSPKQEKGAGEVQEEIYPTK